MGSTRVPSQAGAGVAPVPGATVRERRDGGRVGVGVGGRAGAVVVGPTAGAGAGPGAAGAPPPAEPAVTAAASRAERHPGPRHPGRERHPPPERKPAGYFPYTRGANGVG